MWNYLLHATRPSPSLTGDGTGGADAAAEPWDSPSAGAPLTINACLEPRERSLRARSQEPQPVRRH